jgi:nucleoside phosphorylase
MFEKLVQRGHELADQLNTRVAVLSDHSLPPATPIRSEEAILADLNGWAMSARYVIREAFGSDSEQIRELNAYHENIRMRGRLYGISDKTNRDDVYTVITLLHKFEAAFVTENDSADAPTGDVGIIVALPDEFRELHNTLPSPHVIKDERTGASDYLFTRPVSNRAAYRCAATFVGFMGPTAAALATERFLNRQRPKTIVMLGIAAGISEDVQLGDVIMATYVGRYLDHAKIVSGKGKTFEIRPGGDAFSFSLDLIRASLELEFAHKGYFESWQQAGDAELSQLVADEHRAKLRERDWVRKWPRFVAAPVASGPVVAASEEFINWVKSTNRNYAALEMEGGAMLAAVYSRADPSRSLMLRGVSDFGDKRKGVLDRIGKGALRRYATRNAIRLLWSLMDADVFPRTNQTENPQ